MQPKAYGNKTIKLHRKCTKNQVHLITLNRTVRCLEIPISTPQAPREHCEEQESTQVSSQKPTWALAMQTYRPSSTSSHSAIAIPHRTKWINKPGRDGRTLQASTHYCSTSTKSLNLNGPLISLPLSLTSILQPSVTPPSWYRYPSTWHLAHEGARAVQLSAYIIGV